MKKTMFLYEKKVFSVVEVLLFMYFGWKYLKRSCGTWDESETRIKYYFAFK